MPDTHRIAMLQGADVFVYTAEPAQYEDERSQARLLAGLDETERARAARFRFDADRQTYVVAHALTRRVLGDLLSMAPEVLRFAPQRYGRPELAFPDRASELRFNLSHTTGLVACAVSRFDVGVDVEYRPRRAEIDRLIPSVLAPGEQAAMARLEGDDRRRRFFQYWTLKEAYIKGVGQGLGLPLRGISFDVSELPRAQVALEGIEDDARSWAFALAEPTATHQLAVAVRAPLQALPSVQAIPL